MCRLPIGCESIAKAGQVVAEVLEELASAIVPGETCTIELDQQARAICAARGAVPAFVGYRGYPAASCISVNDAVVHGIPSERRLVSGDIVSLDFACSVDGWFADGAITVPVGTVAPEALRLIAVTREALYAGIAVALPGNRIGDIGAAIQRHVEHQGFSVVRSLVGHGIGSALHEPPAVPNYGRPGTGPLLREGMVLAVEPMVTAGGYAVRTEADGWTVVTQDSSLAAHIEHTIVITRRGAEIMTLTALSGV